MASPGGEGGTRSIHDGGSDVFFWVENLHARMKLGIFWVKGFVAYLFLGLISFCFGFSLRSVDQKNIHSNFFQRRVFHTLESSA